MLGGRKDRKPLEQGGTTVLPTSSPPFHLPSSPILSAAHSSHLRSLFWGRLMSPRCLGEASRGSGDRQGAGEQSSKRAWAPNSHCLGRGQGGRGSQLVLGGGRDGWERGAWRLGTAACFVWPSCAALGLIDPTEKGVPRCSVARLSAWGWPCGVGGWLLVGMRAQHVSLWAESLLGVSGEIFGAGGILGKEGLLGWGSWKEIPGFPVGLGQGEAG